MYTSFTDMPAILTAKEVQELTRLSRAGAYNLINSNKFPVIYLGKRKVVPKETFLKWLDTSFCTLGDGVQKGARANG